GDLAEVAGRVARVVLDDDHRVARLGPGRQVDELLEDRGDVGGPLRLAGDAVPDPHRDVLPDHLGRRAGTGGDVVARLLLRDRRVAGGGDARDLQAGVALGRPVIRIRTPVDGRELDVGARDRGAGRD